MERKVREGLRTVVVLDTGQSLISVDARRFVVLPNNKKQGQPKLDLLKIPRYLIGKPIPSLDILNNIAGLHAVHFILDTTTFPGGRGCEWNHMPLQDGLEANTFIGFWWSDVGDVPALLQKAGFVLDDVYLYR